MTQKKIYPEIFSPLITLLLVFLLQACQRPKEDIVLRQIKDVVADATSDPLLKAQAIFYNPNKIRGKLKHISVDIYVNGKKAGSVKKDYKILIPSQGEFTVPLEVNLNIKELGLLDTVLGMIGGKKFEVRYDGYLRLLYRGVPIKVPIDYKDEVRIRF